MKNALLIISTLAFAAPVAAGPYVNLEAKQKWSGEDYKSATLELSLIHI